jgi:hypothetical protein
MVVLAWKKLYGTWPSFRELVCIFLHDIGHWGLDYLNDVKQKNKHWRLGARVAGKLFGGWGYWFCAGHCKQSGASESKLYRADKYSWHLAPTWWLWTNNVFEPKLKIGFSSNIGAVRNFRKFVSDNIDSGKFAETHECYLERKRRAEETI